MTSRWKMCSVVQTGNPLSNAHQKRCPECNALLPEGRDKFCSTKCATRTRVRRHRLKHSDEGTAHVKIRRQQLRQRIKREQIAARKALRNAATLKRGELRRLNREITRDLAREISESDRLIAQKHDIGVASDFDNNRIAIAIAASDSR